MRHKWKLSATFQPWTTRKDVRLTGVPLSERVREVLDVAWGVRLSSNEDKGYEDTVLRKGFFVDLSQGVERTAWGDLGVFATGTPITITH